MNPVIKYPDQPNASPRQISDNVIRLVGQLGDGATAILVVGVSLASGLNKIQHQQKRNTPRSVSFVPYTNVAWWAPTRPDATFAYIETAGAVVGDLQVWL